MSYGTLQGLLNGLQASAPPGMTLYPFDSPIRPRPSGTRACRLPFPGRRRSTSRMSASMATNHTFDLAIARDVNVGGSRRLELRGELYNAFKSTIFTARSSLMQLANLAPSTTAVNLPYDANGNVIDPRRLTWRNAGFGVVTDARPPRVAQLTFRLSF